MKALLLVRGTLPAIGAIEADPVSQSFTVKFTRLWSAVKHPIFRETSTSLNSVGDLKGYSLTVNDAPLSIVSCELQTFACLWTGGIRQVQDLGAVHDALALVNHSFCEAAASLGRSFSNFDEATVESAFHSVEVSVLETVTVLLGISSLRSDSRAVDLTFAIVPEIPLVGETSASFGCCCLIKGYSVAVHNTWVAVPFVYVIVKTVAVLFCHSFVGRQDLIAVYSAFIVYEYSVKETVARFDISGIGETDFVTINHTLSTF